MTLSNCIYLELNQENFSNSMKKIRPDNFTDLGLVYLYDALLQECEAFESPLILDPIAICCDYSEDEESEIRRNYSLDEDTNVIDYLSDNSIICGQYQNKNGENVFIYRAF